MEVYINDDFIKLQQVLKLARLVDEGSQAKFVINEGLVKLNGNICTQRGKKVVPGDKVYYDGNTVTVLKK